MSEECNCKYCPVYLNGEREVFVSYNPEEVRILYLTPMELGPKDVSLLVSYCICTCTCICAHREIIMASSSNS